MARKPRFNLAGVPQHVIQRGNNREPCFFCVEDYQRYLSDLSNALAQNECRLHAYVLMTNHVHLLVTPMADNGVSHLMQDLGRKYVRYINHRYRRSGTLWEGRYKASLVDSEAYLLTCMRYIELNPLRANMVTHPGEYPWSSHAKNAYARADRMISPHPVYAALAADAESRCKTYRGLFSCYLSPDVMDNIREAVNKELVLGREDFKDRIEQMIERQARPRKTGRPRTTGVAESFGSYYV